MIEKVEKKINLHLLKKSKNHERIKNYDCWICSTL